MTHIELIYPFFMASLFIIGVAVAATVKLFLAARIEVLSIPGSYADCALDYSVAISILAV